MIKRGYDNILGLAGMELTFVTASPMVLRFGFVTRTVLVTLADQRLHSLRTFSISHSAPPPQQGGLGGQDAGSRTADSN